MAAFFLSYAKKTKHTITQLSAKLDGIEADTKDILDQLLEDDEITKSYDKVIKTNMSNKD